MQKMIIKMRDKSEKGREINQKKLNRKCNKGKRAIIEKNLKW